MDTLKAARHSGAGREDVIGTRSGGAGPCSRAPMTTVELRDEAPVKYADGERTSGPGRAGAA